MNEQWIAAAHYTLTVVQGYVPQPDGTYLGQHYRARITDRQGEDLWGNPAPCYIIAYERIARLAKKGLRECSGLN